MLYRLAQIGVTLFLAVVVLFGGLIALHAWQRYRIMKRFHRAFPDHNKRPTSEQLLHDVLRPADDTPDDPISFGFKMMWLAVSTEDSGALIEDLSMESARPANWKSGFVTAYNGGVFVTPPIQGWTLVASLKLPDPSDPHSQVQRLLERLSKRFGRAQLFASHRIVGLFAWMRYEHGRETRAYCFLGETGEVLFDRGTLTEIEATLGLSTEPTDAPKLPDEDDVLKVAGAWSVDPSTLESSTAAGRGWIGVMPTSRV